MMPSLSRLFVRLLGRGALLAILLVVFLARDGFARWPLSAYPISPASSHSWDEVFARPAPIVVETLVTGFIDMNRCDNLDQSNPATASCRSPEPLADLVHLGLAFFHFE